MGWLWGSNPPTPSTPSTDPLRDLDPTLRDFLHTSTPSTSPSPPPPPPPSQLPPDPSLLAPESTTPTVPPQSLYPDGRYADLWRTYRPLSEIESATQTDQEKLMEVLEGYKQRKAEIGRTALENCALEQGAVDHCFRKGGWSKRMGMCREENRAFERCFLMQSRFLKALGYLATADRDPKRDEAIQMHADTLYHRMLAQERATAAAEAAGDPTPSFPPILSPSPPSPFQNPQPQPADKSDPLSPSARMALTKRLKDLPSAEREVEERAVSMEAKAGERVGRELGNLWEERGKKRKERREKGEATVGDTISGWFGW